MDKAKYMSSKTYSKHRAIEEGNSIIKATIYLQNLKKITTIAEKV